MSAPSVDVMVGAFKRWMKDKSSSPEEADEKIQTLLLDMLKQADRFDVKYLKSSKAGSYVSKAAKTGRRERIRETAKALIRRWKKMIKKDKKRKREPEEDTKTSNQTRAKRRTEDDGRANGATKSDASSEGKTDLPIRRQHFRKLLLKRLGGDAKTMGSVANEIETTFFVDTGSNDGAKAYMSRAQSILLHMDENPALTKRLLDGQLDPSVFAKMSPAEMMSDEARKAELAVQDRHFEAMKEGTGRNKKVDGSHECIKCKSRNTSYYFRQTRSADEPMTCFVNCFDCGKKWRY